MENDRDFKEDSAALRGKKCAVIVAHPDDETLWAGGFILLHPQADWQIITLCRGSDADRAPRFRRALSAFQAAGAMGDLDDGPEQTPLDPSDIETAILNLLADRTYDLIITHSPAGEYSRHRRHEETARAVLSLLRSGRLKTTELRLFAYHDRSRRELPKPIPAANVKLELPETIWQRKYELITIVYGFDPESWEARTTPKTESFWRFVGLDEVEQTIREKSGMQ